MSFTTEEMLQVAINANLLSIMGQRRTRSVTLDIIPARGAVIVPRLDEDDDSLTAPRPTIQTLVFHLEDAIFGTTTFAAITCQGRIIASPFEWESWDHLANAKLTVS